MRALVTGAYGFVGRHLVGELVSSGYEVSATDIAVSPGGATSGSDDTAAGAGPGAIDGPGFPAGIPFKGCDLLDGESVKALLGECRPDYVFHLAAQSSAALSFVDPRGTIETNVISTLNILEALKESAGSGHGSRMLSIGSSEEYGRRLEEEMPLGEDSPIEPVSPYAVSKVAQGLLSLQYHRSYGIDVVLTRSFGHTGPGQTDRFVLPAFAKQCAQIEAGLKEPMLAVGNLEVVRDFLDVRDVVKAYRLLAEKGRCGEAYNVCSGLGIRLNDALDTLIGMVRLPIKVETDPDLLRPADVPVMIGDNSKLCKDTGWTPGIQVDGMLSGLMEFWRGTIGGDEK